MSTQSSVVCLGQMVFCRWVSSHCYSTTVGREHSSSLQLAEYSIATGIQETGKHIYSYSCKFNSKKQIAAIMVAAGCSLIPWIALSALLGSVVCEDPNQPLGSPVQLGESEPGVKKILEFTEERYNLGSNAMHRRKISRFISVTRQVTLTARLRHNFFIYLFNIDYITCTVCHCKQSLLCSVNVRVGVQNKGTHCLSIHSLFFRHKERRYIVF